jgi:hypothetical protein
MLYAEVKRGQNIGIRLTPHKYRNGKYHVAKKKGGPYFDVDFDDIASWVRRGYGVRMSNKPQKHPPGLIMPESIQGWK